VKVKLDAEGEAYTYKTTDLKHLEEMASAGASAAGGVASAMGGNGFANGGPGTLKRAKKPAKEAALLGTQYKDGRKEHRPDTAMGSDKVPAAKGPGKFGQKHPLKGKLVGGD
jgi:hypothetical protein